MLTAAVLASATSLSTTGAHGAIVTRVDSSQFNHQINGDVSPDQVAGNSPTPHWTVSGGIIEYAAERQTDTAMFGWVSEPGMLTDPDGWTAEVRFQITDTPDFSDTTFSIRVGSTNNRFYQINIDDDRIAYFDSGNQPENQFVLANGTYADEFHVLRMAHPGGNDSTVGPVVWLDGVMLTSNLPFAGVSNSLNQAVVGQILGTQSGAASIDYFRFDSTAGFAPFIPEPASAILLGCGALLVLRRRSRAA